MVKMAGMVKWFKLHSWIFFIIAFGLFLRLINLRSWFQFEFDEEVIAWKLRQFIVFGKPFLIGGGTPFGFHLGPVFYYLSAIPLWFSNLDPIGWGIMAAVFGTATIWLMWVVGKTLYNQRTGLIAALLWATSFTAVMTDRHWWPLVLDQMLSLIVILCLFYILKIVKFIPWNGIPLRGTNQWWMILGLALAIAWQADLTTAVLFLAVIPVLIFRFKSDWKGPFLTLGILFLSLLPLVAFEIRHPGQNLGKIFQYNSHELSLAGLGETVVFIPAALSRLILPMTNSGADLVKFYGWCKEWSFIRTFGQPVWMILIGFAVIIFPWVRFIVTQRLSDGLITLIEFSGIIGIIIFSVAGGDLQDFYLGPVFPVFLLSSALIIGSVQERLGKLLTGVIIFVFVFGNLSAFINTNHKQSLAIKQQAVAWSISSVGEEGFDLDSISNCSRYNGTRYLFLLGGKEPQSSFVDQDLYWLYDKKDDYMKPKYLVTFITPDDLTPEQNKQYNQLKLEAIDSKVFSPSLEVIMSKHD